MEPRDEFVTDRRWFYQLFGVISQQLGENLYQDPDNADKWLTMDNFSISVQEDGFNILGSISRDGKSLVTKTLTYREESEENGEATIICMVKFYNNYRPPIESLNQVKNKYRVTPETVYRIWQAV